MVAKRPGGTRMAPVRRAGVPAPGFQERIGRGTGTRAPFARIRPLLLVLSLLGPAAPGPAAAPQAAADAPEPAGPARTLVEAFQKGPITMSAQVVRDKGQPGQSVLPLFQVPVLKFRDQLEVAFTGEAFDPKVTRADWSLIVVFLPRTIAPADQGVVDCRLKHKDGRMVVPAIPVPYDSIPMLFLVPDSSGRKKVLKDLNDHLQAFRTLCAKIADLAEQRAVADKFLQDLDAIDKSLSPAQYDNALLGFLNTYGDQTSADLQGFLGGSSSNLAKCQFVTDEFRKTNVLVPAPGPAQAAAPATAQVTVGTGPGRPVCAYVSIFFDLAEIIHNLWPGHQFQYLPALARNFHGSDAELYYSDWIHTTGEVRGALMCCPGRWQEQDPPAFTFELPPGESLLAGQTLLKVQCKEKDRTPFALYGHDWKLLLAGPKGESLAPVSLGASPNRDAFVASPGAIQAALRRLGATRVKARIVGRWGFTNIAMGPVDLPAGCDPDWKPSPQEAAAFRAGKACAFTFPAVWAGSLGRVVFRRSAAGAAPLVATLKTLKDGTRQAVFTPGPEEAGAGALEIMALGDGKPAVSCPVTLGEAAPEVTGIEARLGEAAIRVKGRFLQGILSVELEGRGFLAADPGSAKGPGRTFRAQDGKPLAGSPGQNLQAILVTAQGRQPGPVPVTLMAERPKLGEVLAIPGGAKGAGLPVASDQPILSTNDPCLVSLCTADGYRFPGDGAFRVAIRNADDPSAVRTVPAARLRITGRNQKATFPFNPNDLLGGRAAGRLEIQVQDDHAGASDWRPLPATFLDLPVISSVQAVASGSRLVGPSLDPIESVAATPAGPWEKLTIALEGGREEASLATRLGGGTCYLKLIGWGDLVLALKFPPPPPAPETRAAATGAQAGPEAPGPKAAPPAAPAESRPAAPPGEGPGAQPPTPPPAAAEGADPAPAPGPDREGKTPGASGSVPAQS